MSEPQERYLHPGELMELGLPRDAARLAGWVQATYWSQGHTWSSQSRLAAQWGTTRQAVSRAVVALVGAGVWERMRVAGRPAMRFVTRQELEACGRLPRASRRASVTDSMTRGIDPVTHDTEAMRGDTDPVPPAATRSAVTDPVTGCHRPDDAVSPTRCTGNKGNQEEQQQSAREADLAASPAAAGSRGGDGDGAVGATEPTEQDSPRSRGDVLQAVESLLGRIGLTGSGVRDLAHQLVQHAADAGQDPIELTATAGDEARRASNPAGWMRRAIEEGWVASKIRPTAVDDGAHRVPNASSPVDAPPRISPRTWDIELERAVLFAVAGGPDQVRIGRVQCSRWGGVEPALSAFRKRLAAAPTELVGTLLPAGLARWREIEPDLEAMAAKALALAVDAGAIEPTRAVVGA